MLREKMGRCFIPRINKSISLHFQVKYINRYILLKFQICELGCGVMVVIIEVAHHYQ